MASGGGYGGPLVYRNGKGMRPDVAAAFDRMAAAAAADGVSLLVVSGFRSDAEQAALFAAHPDPNWVAPPGHSLHRCATELDLGPDCGLRLARRQRHPVRLRAALLVGGLALRVRRPARRPARRRAKRGGLGAGGGGGAGGGAGAGGSGGDGVLSASALPDFVPAEFRPMIVRAAVHWNVSAALLAGQLMAESGFDPNAGSPAGAQGIAQFMPGTAASYGLRNPYDPAEAIDAEAHLMSDLLVQFGSPELALAAYNAGPAPVEACHCIPPYPETQAYVTRILALLGGAGALVAPEFEVRLVA